MPTLALADALADIQGNVVLPYSFPCGTFLLLRVSDPSAARAALARAVDQITSSAFWTPAQKPHSTFNLAFSFSGLKALGLSRATLDGFPIAFQMGMKTRAPILGDSGASSPSSWSAPWQADVHVLASIYGDNPAEVAARLAQVKSVLSGFETLGQEEGALLAAGGGRKEHFGFTDGISGTAFEGVPIPASNTPREGTGDGKVLGDGSVRPLALGELLFGYKDESDEYPLAPEPEAFAKNGTFLVVRKLKQSVQLFRDYLDKEGKAYPGGKEKLAAKFVGRWRDGTPLVLRPDGPDPNLAADGERNNDFRYAGDTEGQRCPLGAHMRRARPRDAMTVQDRMGKPTGSRLTDRRRIVRRGLPYGPWAPEDRPITDDIERGILFMALNVDIERQFEFIQQQWLNYGNHFLQSNDKDVLLGNHDGTGKAVIQASSGDDIPHLCTHLPRFVEVRGGEYFFVPGMTAMRLLAKG
jgi:Dyp-type peroxidase family